MSAKLAIVPKDEEQNAITIDGHASRELMATIALGALRGAVGFLKTKLDTSAGVETPAASPPPLAATESDRDVMTADER